MKVLRTITTSAVLFAAIALPTIALAGLPAPPPPPPLPTHGAPGPIAGAGLRSSRSAMGLIGLCAVIVESLKSRRYRRTTALVGARTSDHHNARRGLPNITHCAGSGISLRAIGELAVELGKQGPARRDEQFCAGGSQRGIRAGSARR